MPKLKPNQFVIANKVVTERPILYSTEMVKATLEDRKTQTRRGKGLEEFNFHPYSWDRKNDPRQSKNRFWSSDIERNPNPIEIAFGFNAPDGNRKYIKSQYGQPGDLLWVKESYGIWLDAIKYKADPESVLKGFKWKPSIFLRKSYARIWLMIEDVTIERIQDISEEDTIAEGVKKIEEEAYKYDESIGSFASSRSAFRALWWEINGPDSWKQNPWVWVITFRVLSKTGRPDNDTILEHLTEVLKDTTRFQTILP